MGKSILPQNNTVQELLNVLHNSIELHMMVGLRLAPLMDMREEAQETGVHIIGPIDLQARITSLVDHRKSLRNDIFEAKNLIVSKLENMTRPHLDDIDVLEASL